MHHAAANSHLEAVKLVQGAGAEVESKDKGRQTPLSHAATNGHLEVLKKLLEAGAGVESKNIYGRAPLSCAAQNGHVDVVKLLLGARAMVESKDHERGRTPLSWAALNGHVETVKWLVQEAGSQGKDGRTPLDLALATVNGETYRRWETEKQCEPRRERRRGVLALLEGKAA